jgi:hypothetical protein
LDRDPRDVGGGRRAAEFRAYPGAQRDQQPERLISSDPRSSAAGAQSKLYVTADPFDKVYEFYKAIGAEGPTLKKLHAPKLPNGTAVSWAFFMFDGAKSISGSTYWIKIQRPTVLDVDVKDVRDVTSIKVVRKK